MIGGINSSNALSYLEAGAAQVIVTSYVFLDGRIQFDRLEELVQLVGRDRLVLDLSCRRRADAFDGLYYVVTNKWTKFTDFSLTSVVHTRKALIILFMNFTRSYVHFTTDLKMSVASVSIV